MTVRLYDYWRSSASYRVRIALNLKGVAYETMPTSLVDNDQLGERYGRVNPQHFVPALDIDGHVLTQSLAIMDYLDATRRDPPFVPDDPLARSRVLAMALIIACDIHPLNNLRVLRYLGREFGVDEPARDGWYRHWLVEGLAALESLAPETQFLGGAAPGFADICLVPQMYNARRFDVDVTPYPKLVAADLAAQKVDAFTRAHPDAVRPEPAAAR